jgi:uncharacterized RDD family membrane protein YckC
MTLMVVAGWTNHEAFMTVPTESFTELSPVGRVAYASFSSRMNALFMDVCVIMLSALVLFVFAAVTESIPGTGRVAVIGLFALFFLYEPIMVWQFGGTIGHRWAHLRIVDDATGRAPSFPRAFARYVIKGFLGLLSFATMAVTRRHQSMHDSLTRTTVQIRDPAIVREADIRWERNIVEPVDMPSRGRRIGVILAYLLLSYIGLTIALGVLLSEPCIVNDQCSGSEQVSGRVLGLGWIAVASLIIIAGWRAKLWGCRPRGTETAT